jgi:hypothetical protein
VVAIINNDNQDVTLIHYPERNRWEIYRGLR